MKEISPTNEYKYKLKAEEFVKLFLASDDEFDNLANGNEGITRERGNTRLTSVIIEGNIFIRSQVRDNCYSLFCDHVKIENLIIAGSNLSYLNGKHKTQFNFQNCEIEGIYINAGSSIGNLFIEKDCKVGTTEISQASIAFVEINYTSINEFSISTNSKINTIIIKNAIFDKFWFFLSDAENIDFSCCSIKDFTITESNCKSLKIFSTILSKSIRIESTKLNDSSITYCTTETILLNFLVLRSLKIEHFGGSISIDGTKMLELNISESTIEKLRLTQYNEFDAFISDSAITQLDFSKTILNKQTTITFSKVAFFDISISDFTCLGSLFFREMFKSNAPIELIPFEEFTRYYNAILSCNEKSKSFNQIEAYYGKKIISTWKLQYSQIVMFLSIRKKCYSKIRITQSSLGKTEFTDCPLSEFRFEFNNSKITDCFVSGGSIPINNVHIIGAEQNSLKEHEQKASFFNQFKMIFEAQGDIYHATQFQAKWAEEERKYLKLQRKKEISDIGFSSFHIAFNKIRDWIVSCFKFIFKPLSLLCRWIEKTNFWKRVKIYFNPTSNDLITLWLNKISNLHGESYLRALAFIFISALVLYFVYLYSINRLHFGGKFDPNLIGYFFEFINPAHRLNFIEGNKTETINGLTVTADFVGRIFVSYGIYQFIAAFRKHTKKQ
jgi:hypothetical protein